MLKSAGGPNSGLPYSWNPDYPARVGVMRRDSDGSGVRWFAVEPCYVFHPLNAYDDGDDVVLDVVRHPKMFATDLQGPNEGAPTLERWTVDTAAGKVLEERVDDHPQEFPRVDERLVSKRHRYGYSVGFNLRSEGPGDALNALFKHDLVSGTTQVRDFGPRAGASEFVFEPSSPDAAEDDGVLMGFVYDGDRDASDLLFLDAGSLDTVATVQLPHREPYGFHGNWVPTGS
jgi:carotenoid cleavage dioxygenase